MRLRVGFACLLGLVSVAAQARTLGAIRFESCELRAPHQTASVAAECASYEVAEDAARPNGRKIALRLALVAAQTTRPKPDLVVYLAGGPGQSGLESFVSYSPGFRRLLRRRNVLLIDQRGTGGSNRLDCPVADGETFSEPTADQRRADLQRCLEAVSSHADPRRYTTTDSVRDLETVRRALGAPQLDLVGASYGTRLALSYLRTHPEGVRSLVLDGVVPAQTILGQDHARALDEALAKMFAACAGNAECASRFGDPSHSLASLRQRLRVQPLTLSLPDPRTRQPRSLTVDGQMLASIVRFMAYQPELSALLPLLLNEALHGRPEFLAAQGLILERSLREAVARGMALSVNCTEDVPFLKPDPRDEPRLLGGAVIRDLIEQCGYWPRGELPADFHAPVTSGKPVLMLSGGLDPVTPPGEAEIAARSLSNSRHLVAPGGGHTVLWRGCAARLAEQFVETLEPKQLDGRCLEAIAAPPAFTSYEGPPP